jgi:hypothetical protein
VQARSNQMGRLAVDRPDSTGMTSLRVRKRDAGTAECRRGGFGALAGQLCHPPGFLSTIAHVPLSTQLEQGRPRSHLSLLARHGSQLIALRARFAGGRPLAPSVCAAPADDEDGAGGDGDGGAGPCELRTGMSPAVAARTSLGRSMDAGRAWCACIWRACRIGVARPLRRLRGRAGVGHNPVRCSLDGGRAPLPRTTEVGEVWRACCASNSSAARGPSSAGTAAAAGHGHGPP